MKILYILLLLPISIGLHSQEAPNFKVTDTHGVEHSLYEDYLDKGTTVVLDLFFVDCPPCSALAPLLEESYQQWGAGQGDVQFISLTSKVEDNDANVLAFEMEHGTTWPAVSSEGSGPTAVQLYTTGQWGTFTGFPTLVVIAPDRSVQFDAWGGNLNSTIDILNEWIANTGALGLLSLVEDKFISIKHFELSPNPTSSNTTLKFNLDEMAHIQINIINSLGQKVNNVYDGHLFKGEQRIEFNTSDLTSGINWLEIKMNGQAYTEPFLKY